MRRLRIIILLAALLPMLASCGVEPRDYGDFLTDIVTYDGSAGGMAQFSFQTRDDLPMQRLVASVDVPEKVSPGQRCLLRYTVLGSQADGVKEVRADGFATIPTDAARMAPHSEKSSLPETDISVTSLWRSGAYVNLNGWLPYTGKKYQLMLVADEQTLDEETVEARVVYNTMGEQQMFDRRVYASFDVSALWSRQSCKRLVVGIFDRTFTFEKSSLQ